MCRASFCDGDYSLNCLASDNLASVRCDAAQAALLHRNCCWLQFCRPRNFLVLCPRKDLQSLRLLNDQQIAPYALVAVDARFLWSGPTKQVAVDELANWLAGTCFAPIFTNEIVLGGLERE